MARYILSPQAVDDLEVIKDYLVVNGGAAVARLVLRDLREAMRFLAGTPGAGHSRHDLTDQAVKFWAVFSYLIVYDPAVRPLGIVRVLHGHRDIARALSTASNQPDKA
jgi:toxin ParE1/3/4